jgi:crotonobetaine/carnitine-CoA ligase
MATTLHQAFEEARRRSPGKDFLAESALSGGRSWTFEQVGDEVDRLVARYARSGWGAGHRVALGVGNHPRHFFHFLALNSLGASIVPLNPDHRGGEIRYALSHSGVDLVVSHPDREPALREATRCIERALGALRFPRPTGGAASVVVPYRFAAGG